MVERLKLKQIISCQYLFLRKYYLQFYLDFRECCYNYRIMILKWIIFWVSKFLLLIYCYVILQMIYFQVFLKIWKFKYILYWLIFLLVIENLKRQRQSQIMINNFSCLNILYLMVGLNVVEIVFFKLQNFGIIGMNFLLLMVFCLKV